MSNLATETRTIADSRLAEFIRDKVPVWRERFQPAHIIVFGSRARNDARLDSDIDVVMVGDAFAAIKAPNRLGVALQAIRSEGGLDVFCFTPEEFEKYRRWPGIIKTACEEGIWL